MTDHPAIAAVPVSGTPDRSLLQALLVGRFSYVFGDAEDPTAFVPTGAGGSVTLVLGYQGKWFWFDPADTTTAHDGVTCIVTAGSPGNRYKVFGLDILITSVISHSETAPPVTPDYGDAYRVAAAATGDWSGHDDEIAVWTTREEWEFITPKPGWIVWTLGTAPSGYDIAYHYDSAQGEWLAGFPGQIHPDQTIPQSAVINFGKFFIVEDQTTNAPPATPNIPTAYVIGPSPTGDWTGHAGKLAICEVDDVWTIVTPGEGWRVYDKALNRDFQYSGSAWISASGRWRLKLTQFTSNGTFTKDARCFQVKVSVVASGGGTTGGGGSTGGSVSFGAYLSATGGAANSGINGGAGGAGTASGGITFAGSPGETLESGFYGGIPGLVFGTKGVGAKGSTGANAGGGGGGGAAQLVIADADLTTNVSVTINTNGQNNGYVLVEEYIED